MIVYLNIFKSALLISALFLASNQTIAQKDILELFPGSETLEYDEVTGLHRLIGNVNLTYQGNVMYCDSAHYIEGLKSLKAYGKVHVNKHDTLNLYCDSLHYNGRTKKSKLWGNVRVIDNEYKITTDTLEYDANKSQAFYRHGGKVVSTLTQEELTSHIGYFYPESKNFFFSKDVDYKGKNLSIKSDTLQYLYNQKKTFFYGETYIQTKDANIYCESGWYNTNTGEGSLIKNAYISRKTYYIAGDTLISYSEEGVSIGLGNVYYRDSTQDILFNGDYAYTSDSLNYSFLTGHAIATKIMTNDTLYIHADTLFVTSSDSIDVMKAYHEAKLYSTKLQCLADSIIYRSESDLIELYFNPIVWSNGAELKGTFIDMHVNDSIIHRVKIYENSSILMEIEPELYYNQIAGKNIVASFKDNNLYQALVNGNAITIFYSEEEIKTDSTLTKKHLGMNRLCSSSLRIDIDSNEIIGLNYIQDPDGMFYPMEEIRKEEKFIENFEWKQALRPKSKEALIKD